MSRYYQGHEVTNTVYVEHFKALVGAVESYGRAYSQEPWLVATQLVVQGVKPKDVDTMSQDKIKKGKKVCHKCYLLCIILCGANNSQYFQLKNALSNNMTKGADNFPKTIVETMRLLTNYKAPPRLQQVHDPDGEGLAFVQGKGATPSVQRERPQARIRSNAGTATRWGTTKTNAPSYIYWM